VERNSGGFGGCCCPGFQSRRGRLLDHKNAEPAVKIFMRNVSWRSRCGPSAAAPTASGSASSHTSKTRSEPPSDSVLQWRLIDGVAAGVDDAALREAQQTKDAIRACELVCSALGA